MKPAASSPEKKSVPANSKPASSGGAAGGLLGSILGSIASSSKQPTAQQLEMRRKKKEADEVCRISTRALVHSKAGREAGGIEWQLSLLVLLAAALVLACALPCLRSERSSYSGGVARGRSKV
jgi:hypothetical protein